MTNKQEDNETTHELDKLLSKIADEEKKINALLENAQKKAMQIKNETSNELVIKKESYEKENKEYKNQLIADARSQHVTVVNEIIDRAKVQAKAFSSRSLKQADIETLALSLLKVTPTKNNK